MGVDDLKHRMDILNHLRWKETQKLQGNYVREVREKKLGKKIKSPVDHFIEETKRIRLEIVAEFKYNLTIRAKNKLASGYELFPICRSLHQCGIRYYSCEKAVARMDKQYNG